jgi:glycosyltransferase involved in cell wall biosynthesis
MKLLISAYACAPNRGSEHGSGWNWVVEVSRLGHEVCVLVSSAHRDAIAEAARRDPAVARISWVHPVVAAWPLQQGKEPVWERTYNLLWQWSALKLARELHREVGFDAVHHLTWGGVRAPTFLGALGIPLIIGPVGGGETSPRTLRDRLPLRGRLAEALRDLSNRTIEINPIVRPGLRDAAVIFAKTADTRRLLGPGLRAKTFVQMELGVDLSQIAKSRPPRTAPPKLLYAGRLLYWKGVHIGIEAMAGLVARLPDAQLTIVGDGPEQARLKAEVTARKLDRNVAFIPRMPQDQFMRLYDSHDMLLFPSLHDSTGCVVLEALCKGMPVACLDLGGPRDIVTPQSGIIADTMGLTTAQVASVLADQLYDVFSSPERFAALSAGAIARANDFLLTDQVTRLYEQASAMIAGGLKADRMKQGAASGGPVQSAALSQAPVPYSVHVS